MSEISLRTEDLILFLRENPQTKIWAMPEVYCPTDKPVLMMSYELFQKIWESVYNDKELTNEQD